MLPLLESQYAWGFVCGRVSVLEGQLLPPAFYNTLLGQEQIEDMLRQLQGLPIEASPAQGTGTGQWTEALERYFTALMLSLRRDSPEPAVVDLFLLSGEYFNLKQALMKRAVHPFPKVLIGEEALAAARHGDSSTLPAFAKAVLERLRPAERSTEPALSLDLVVDLVYLQHLLLLSRATGAPLIEAYAHELVLSKAILLLWRAQRLGLPVEPYQRALAELEVNQHLLNTLAATPDPAAWPALIGGGMGHLFTAALEAGESRQTALFEQRVAENLARLAQRGRMQVFGPERLFSYLVSLSQEVFNLKLAVSGRIKHIEVPRIREELRVSNG